MSGSIPIEPSADMREMAIQLRQTYVALTLEGFTTQEALTIIGQIISANSGGSS
jgi:hypothetical protein